MPSKLLRRTRRRDHEIEPRCPDDRRAKPQLWPSLDRARVSRCVAARGRRRSFRSCGCGGNAHHDERGFASMHIYHVASGTPVVANLRPARTPKGTEVRTVIKHVTKRLRQHWPNTRIVWRGDGHYGRVEAMEPLELGSTPGGVVTSARRGRWTWSTAVGHERGAQRPRPFTRGGRAQATTL
jgi:hypothetical protein